MRRIVHIIFQITKKQQGIRKEGYVQDPNDSSTEFTFSKITIKNETRRSTLENLEYI